MDLRSIDGGDTFVEDIAITHQGEVIASVEEATVPDAVRPFDGEIEVMTPLWFQVGITENHIAHITHVEVHIHLLERRRTEATGVVGTEGHPGEFIDNGKSSGKCLVRRSGEIIIAYTSHEIQLVRDVPVELGITVDIVLRMTRIILKLIGRKIIVHIVGTDNQGVLAKRMVIERMTHMLSVAVIMVMGTGAVRREVRLVVLVVGIRQFEMTPLIPRIPALQTGTIGIEMVVVCVALTGTEEIAAPTCQGQLVCSAPDQALFDIVSLLTVKTTDVGIIIQHILVIRQTLCLLHQFCDNFFRRVAFRQIDRVDLGMLETRL